MLLAWYLFVRLGDVPKFVMPSPGATFEALFSPNYDWWFNTSVTATEIFGGYASRWWSACCWRCCSPGRRRSNR